MATLKIRRTKLYARVRWYKKGVQIEKQIALQTSNYSIAIERLRAVNKLEKAIMNGVDLSFPWMNPNGKVKIVKYDLSNAVDEYLSYSKANGNKDTTINRAKCCFNNIKSVLGNSFPIEKITASDIEKIKMFYKGRISDNGINIILSRMRALLNWCRDIKEVISVCPKIKLIKTVDNIPTYFTESDLNAIITTDVIDAYYKNVFRMYWETGMRLREAFTGEIQGDWLVVKPEDSKTGLYREIALQEHHVPVLIEMKSRLSNSKATYRTATGHYSKVFKKMVKKIGRGDLHFHNLRDTFAIMRYLETRDIYQVSKELGHTSVKVTEKYTKFRISKLVDDFPSLAKQYHKNNSVPYTMRDTKTRDTIPHKYSIFEEIMA